MADYPVSTPVGFNFQLFVTIPDSVVTSSQLGNQYIGDVAGATVDFTVGATFVLDSTHNIVLPNGTVDGQTHIVVYAPTGSLGRTLTGRFLDPSMGTVGPLVFMGASYDSAVIRWSSIPWGPAGFYWIPTSVSA